MITAIDVLQEMNRMSQSQPKFDYLLPYYTQSKNPNVNHELFTDNMINRVSIEKFSMVQYLGNERNIWLARINHINAHNEFYNITMTQNPTSQDLKEASLTNAKWSILYPILIYLIHHPSLIPDYQGLYPIGKNVAKAYNHITESDIHLASQTFAEHVAVKNYITQNSFHIGMTTVAFNVYLDLIGRTL